jgi:hypothetical protein
MHKPVPQATVPEADLHHSAGSMLRIRQLSMLQDSDLKLWHHTDQQDVSLIPAPILALASALQTKETTGNAGCPTQHGTPLQKRGPATHGCGITELKEIVSANGTHVLSATDMKRKYGLSIQTRQVHALHRVAYMRLHTEEPVIDVTATE